MHEHFFLLYAILLASILNSLRAKTGRGFLLIATSQESISDLRGGDHFAQGGLTMQHRYEPHPRWKVFYDISYWDWKWDEIKPLAKTGLDAFAVTGVVYEFTQMWARLERGQPIELPVSEVPIAFTVEVYHVEAEENEVVATERLRPGHTPGCDSSSPGRSGITDGPSVSSRLHDAQVGPADANKTSREADDTCGGSTLASPDRYAYRDHDGEDSICVPNNGPQRYQSGHP